MQKRRLMRAPATSGTVKLNSTGSCTHQDCCHYACTPALGTVFEFNVWMEFMPSVWPSRVRSPTSNHVDGSIIDSLSERVLS